MLDLLTIGDIKLNSYIVIPEASVMCELKMPECRLCISYGKKIPVDAFVTQIAGSAPNVAIGVAKYDLNTAVFSIMGEDDTYEHAVRFLEKHKVATNFIHTQKNINSSTSVVLNFKGESTLFVAHASPEYRLPKKMPSAKYLHISELGAGYEKLFIEITKIAVAKKSLISFNPGAIQLKERKKELMGLIAFTDILFLNMTEARGLIGLQNGEEVHALMAGLKNLGPRIIVVTDGKNGAYTFDGKQLDHAPMFPGELVESTGAGDAFSSGFLGAILKKKSLVEALKYGAVNAASVVGHVGPTAGLLRPTQIATALKKHPSYKTQEL